MIIVYIRSSLMSTRNAAPLSLAAAILSALAPLALGQQNDAGHELEEVLVYGTAYRTTGTKSQLRPMEAPMTYEIYDNELLMSRQVDTVNDALRYVPGVTPENRSTVTIFDQYTIRGFESYRNFYNGLALQANGLWNLYPQVDVYATQSVEVLRGPTSVLYGNAPPGGMVNQTAKQPLAAYQHDLRIRTGSNALRELGLDSGGPLGESINYRLIALTRQKDGQQRTTEEERLILAPSLTWQLAENTSLNLNLYYQDDPAMIPSTPLPGVGTVYPAPYGKLDAESYAGDRNWGNFEREVSMLGYKFHHAFSENLSFMQNFRYTDADSLQRNTYNHGLAADEMTLLRSAYFTDETLQGVVIDNQFAWQLKAGGFSHNILFGAEFQTLDSTVNYGDTLGKETASINLAMPNYSLLDPQSLAVDFYTEQHNIDQQQSGIYIQDQVNYGPIILLLGLRYDDYESRDLADKNYDGFAYGDDTLIDQQQMSGRGALIYRFENGWAPYINYSESFEPTAGLDSMTGEAFKPTTARQTEFGVKFSENAGATEFTASYFNLKKQNVVVNTPDYLQYTQTGEITSKGFELQLLQKLGNNLDISANYTDINVSVTENPLNPSLLGTTPVWVSEKIAAVWLDYQFNPALKLGSGVRYVGKSQMDAMNSDSVPGYTLIDLVGSYQVNENYRLGISVSNLSDKRYVGACYDISNCWMGAQRSVEMNLFVNF